MYYSCLYKLRQSTIVIAFVSQGSFSVLECFCKSTTYLTWKISAQSTEKKLTKIFKHAEKLQFWKKVGVAEKFTACTVVAVLIIANDPVILVFILRLFLPNLWDKF